MAMEATFKPSDIVVNESMPFTNTYGCSEFEQVAAAFVRACIAGSNCWYAKTEQEIRAHHSYASSTQQVESLRLDICEMVAYGHLRKGIIDNITAYELVDMTRLAKWIKPVDQSPRIDGTILNESRGVNTQVDIVNHDDGQKTVVASFEVAGLTMLVNMRMPAHWKKPQKHPTFFLLSLFRLLHEHQKTIWAGRE